MSQTNPYIYVIEDEEAISKLICLYMIKSQIDTNAFYTAEDALKSLETDRIPDLIILDLNLPGMSGFEFLQKIRENFKNNMPPVVILSARDADEDIIQGLGYGADEFITKPFSPGVLVARVKANLRRLANAQAKAEDSIQFDDYTVLLNSCVLKKGTTKITLSDKEYKVLLCLINNAGTVMSPESIYQSVWKNNYGDITAVAVYIQRLRKKLEENPTDYKYIKTDFGKGYIFNKDCIKEN